MGWLGRQSWQAPLHANSIDEIIASFHPVCKAGMRIPHCSPRRSVHQNKRRLPRCTLSATSAMLQLLIAAILLAARYLDHCPPCGVPELPGNLQGVFSKIARCMFLCPSCLENVFEYPMKNQVFANAFKPNINLLR